MKKLERSRESCVLGGVCGGLGEYFNIDPVIFRVAFVVLAFVKGIGLIAYIVAWIAIPRRREGEVADTTPPRSDLVKYLPGAALILLGLIFLIDMHYWWFSFWDLWPVVLVAGGVAMIIMAVQKGKETETGERGES